MDLNKITIISMWTSCISTLFSMGAIWLVLYMEKVRKPFIRFLLYDDKKTSNNVQYMWHHLKIENQMPRFKWLNRDSAINCIARVSFLDRSNQTELAPQIEAHWSSQPEPKNFFFSYLSGKVEMIFDPTKVPTCQRMTVGFKDEKFDILIKYEGEKEFYATNPWIIYRYAKQSLEYQRYKINVDECIVNVEIEAINLGKIMAARYHLKNKGTKMDDIEIELLKD